MKTSLSKLRRHNHRQEVNIFKTSRGRKKNCKNYSLGGQKRWNQAQVTKI